MLCKNNRCDHNGAMSKGALQLERRRLASVGALHAPSLPCVFPRKEPAERNLKS